MFVGMFQIIGNTPWFIQQSYDGLAPLRFEPHICNEVASKNSCTIDCACYVVRFHILDDIWGMRRFSAIEDFAFVELLPRRPVSLHDENPFPRFVSRRMFATN
jgi:hypothetical protein